MKELLKILLASILYLFVASLICTYVYKWSNLDSVFGRTPTFENWLAVLIIAHIIFPSTINPRKRNDK